MTMVLAWHDVSYTYPGGAVALDGATLQLEGGERLALLGRNGSGKSTLLLHANGLLRPTQGSIYVEGGPLDYSRHGLRAARHRVGLVFQNPDEQLFSASVSQDISFGPLNLGLSLAEVRQRVAEAAALCDVADLLDRPTHALSGGQKARVALAGVLAMQPLALLADEVVAGLDPWAHRQVLAIFERLVRHGTAVLLATHDVALARRWADRVAIMDRGRVVAVAPPAVAFADPALQALVGPPEMWG